MKKIKRIIKNKTKKKRIVDKKDIDYVAKADITIFLNSYNENYEYASEIIL